MKSFFSDFTDNHYLRHLAYIASIESEYTAQFLEIGLNHRHMHCALCTFLFSSFHSIFNYRIVIFYSILFLLFTDCKLILLSFYKKNYAVVFISIYLYFYIVYQNSSLPKISEKMDDLKI